SLVRTPWQPRRDDSDEHQILRMVGTDLVNHFVLHACRIFLLFCTYRCNRSKTSGSHRNKFLVRIPKQRCDRSPPSLLGYSAQSPELLRRGSFHTAFGLIRSSASRRDSATRCRCIYLHLRRTPTR